MRYRFDTRIGPFFIERRADRWHVMHDGVSLGGYDNPQQAASDVAVGHTFWPRGGVDPGSLRISDDLGDWEAER